VIEEVGGFSTGRWKVSLIKGHGGRRRGEEERRLARFECRMKDVV
jgi:hypothetical protein